MSRYFELSGKSLGVVELGAGAIVRQVNDDGYGRKLQIKGSNGKIYNLETANVETRDTWVFWITKVGASGGGGVW